MSDAAPEPLYLHEIITKKLTRWKAGGPSTTRTLFLSIDEKPVPVSTLVEAKKEISVFVPKARARAHGWTEQDERELVVLTTSLDRLLTDEPDVGFDWVVAVNGPEADIERAEDLLVAMPTKKGFTYVEIIDRSDREDGTGTDFDIEATPDEAWFAVEQLQAAGLAAFLINANGEDVSSFEEALACFEVDDDEEGEDDDGDGDDDTGDEDGDDEDGDDEDGDDEDGDDEDGDDEDGDDEDGDDDDEDGDDDDSEEADPLPSFPRRSS